MLAPEPDWLLPPQPTAHMAEHAPSHIDPLEDNFMALIIERDRKGIVIQRNIVDKSSSRRVDKLTG